MLSNIELIGFSLVEAQRVLDDFVEDPQTLKSLGIASCMMIETLMSGGKIMSCGNGGSLCDASHFAEELTGRYRETRRPYPAMACNDSAYLTCTANDFSYDMVFSRWVEAFGKPEDILLAISTSGTSENVIKAAKTAKNMGMRVVALTSKGKSPLSAFSDVSICSPKCQNSDRIQEIHIKIIHILIELIEHGLGY